MINEEEIGLDDNLFQGLDEGLAVFLEDLLQVDVGAYKDLLLLMHFISYKSVCIIC